MSPYFERDFPDGGALSLGQKLRGHYMTLRPFVERSLRPIARPETKAWSCELIDLVVGPVELTGRFLERSSEETVIVVHGLGGNTESGYVALALRAADEAGRSCLLLNCRGADRRGADVYHSGLCADIEAALESDELRSMKQVDLLGYSIGGHIALKYACGKVDARVRRVAAVGSPLHLRAAADDFDAAAFNVYRTHVMDALKEIYTAAYQRNPRGIRPEVAREIGKIRDWDEQVIAPRFGFQSADHYYESESVGPILDQLKIEALYVGASCDPMILKKSVMPFTRAPRLRTIWDERAGHLGFAEDCDLGLPGGPGVERQVLKWLAS